MCFIYKKTKALIEKELNEDVEGEYDTDGFFNTPNGSFSDPDGVYFNREGYDKHDIYFDGIPKNMNLEMDGMILIIVIKMNIKMIMMINFEVITKI